MKRNTETEKLTQNLEITNLRKRGWGCFCGVIIDRN
jgi:hypothetical protein